MVVPEREFDVVIIGGGLVGAAVAYGLSSKNCKVAVLDEGDRAFRASRGNFGLVWVQGKGWDYPAYAKWTAESARCWPALAERLKVETGIDVQYQQPGGLEFCLTDQDLEQNQVEMAAIAKARGGEFSYEILDHSAVAKLVPQVSRHVIGASFCHHDGHVNPLYLLRGLHTAMDQNGVSYFPGETVSNIQPESCGFIVYSGDSRFSCNKVVLCAGLGNQQLGEKVGISIPVQANRGQLLITEKVAPFLPYPTLHVRQTAEGGLQIGDSKENVGLNDHTSTKVIEMLAARAHKIFPVLENVRVVRAWAALRVMTPDGKPIYQQSSQYPGAYGIACHSGVTLAAAHVELVSDWLLGNAKNELLDQFSASRFNVY